LIFSLTEDYNLELQYRKPFLDIWEEEKNDRELGALSERMGVRNRATGELNMTQEEKDAASEYCSPPYTLPLLTFLQASTMPFASTRFRSAVPYWPHMYTVYDHYLDAYCLEEYQRENREKSSRCAVLRMRRER
jgi:hypothetical protein